MLALQIGQMCPLFIVCQMRPDAIGRAARSTGYCPCDAASGSLAKLTAIPSDLPDRIASVFLLLALFGKQIDYLLSV